MRRSLQVFLVLLGSVAVASAATTLLFGATTIAGVEKVSPEIDSEMRFFAAWYLAAGIVILRCVPRVGESDAAIRAIAIVFFVAGCSRALSIWSIGTPHPVALTLMWIELALPFVLIPWQHRVASRHNEMSER